MAGRAEQQQRKGFAVHYKSGSHDTSLLAVPFIRRLIEAEM